jgi:hypothetical protein
MSGYSQGTKGSHNPHQHKAAKGSLYAHDTGRNANLQHAPYDIRVKAKVTQGQPQPSPPGKEDPQTKAHTQALNNYVARSGTANTHPGKYPPAEDKERTKDQVERPDKEFYPQRRQRIP